MLRTAFTRSAPLVARSARAASTVSRSPQQTQMMRQARIARSPMGAGFKTSSSPRQVMAAPAAATRAEFDATACVKELEIALSRGEISREEFEIGVVRLEAKSGDRVSAAADESLMMTRTKRMLEVTVSKIGPAGFGWQMASIHAGNAGLASTSLGFFAATGLGDMIGVLVGHTGFKALTKMAGHDVDMVKEAQVGTLLGSAAFCSGFVWQPTLNAMQALELDFTASALGVGTVCTAAFYAGLRFFRSVYSSAGMKGVEANNYDNLKADFGLSVAIGGATAAFVGTDVSFGGSNWLAPIVGISETCPDVTGQVIAGSSTALGFLAVQSAQNSVLGKGKNWID